KELRRERIHPLPKPAEERRLEYIRVQIQAQTGNPEQPVAQAALRALSDLDSRFSVSGNRVSGTQNRPTFSAPPPPPPRHEAATQASSAHQGSTPQPPRPPP